jgi:hypothetical protein
MSGGGIELVHSPTFVEAAEDRGLSVDDNPEPAAELLCLGGCWGSYEMIPNIRAIEVLDDLDNDDLDEDSGVSRGLELKHKITPVATPNYQGGCHIRHYSLSKDRWRLARRLQPRIG